MASQLTQAQRRLLREALDQLRGELHSGLSPRQMRATGRIDRCLSKLLSDHQPRREPAHTSSAMPQDSLQLALGRLDADLDTRLRKCALDAESRHSICVELQAMSAALT